MSAPAGEAGDDVFVRPWARVKVAAAIPSPLTADVLAAMDDETFARMVRDNLLPRDDRAAWGRLWAVLSGSGRLADRAGEVLDRLLDVSEDALQAGALDEREQVRARKFVRVCEEAADRITVDEDDPLAWAGSSVVAFNPPARKVIAQLVDAIAAHRRLVGDQSSAADRRLWRVLRQTGLDPNA